MTDMNREADVSNAQELKKSAIAALRGQPVEIAKFWKTARDRRHAVVVKLQEYEGWPLVDMRVAATGNDGISRPTNKGLALNIAKLPELIKALQKAERRAREMGLLDGGSDDEPA